MNAVKEWLMLGEPLFIAMISLGSVAIGALLRQWLKKLRIWVMFVPFIVYAIAEYTVSQPSMPESHTLWVMIGGIAAMIFMGTILKSALIRFYFKLEK